VLVAWAAGLPYDALPAFQSVAALPSDDLENNQRGKANVVKEVHELSV